MRVCYIAGPFRHSSPAQMAAHVLTAQAAAADLARLGWAPYCPHANLGHAYGQIDEPLATRINTRFLDLADAIYLLPGWEASPGAQQEVRHMRRSRKPTFDSLAAVRAWG